MKHILTALATFAVLAILGKRERVIRELREELEGVEMARHAMACELMHRRHPAVITDNRLNTEH